jgi:5-methylcytosine-specific restriction endonuclease McrA
MHYRENRERLLAKQQAYYRENRDARRQYNAEHYLRNQDQAIKKALEWAQANPEKASANWKRGTARRRAKKAEVLHIPYSSLELTQKLSYWGNSCYLKGRRCTGSVDAVEHVIPLSRGGADVLANLRPVCTPCNSSKWAHWPYPIPYYPQ